ncbi:LRAT domain-containing protein [Aphelenchoides bicaudatus]|nr:LRAT domain-containing protein [Aphelenchoides bicaudatus]
MAILNKQQLLLHSKSPIKRVVILLVDQILPASFLNDSISYVFRYVDKAYVLLKDAFFPQGQFDWRHAKTKFFYYFFSYYQEDFIDFEKRPELKGLVTEWMHANELSKYLKLGDLVEFKGTQSGFTLFHHWSICVRVNTEVEADKRTPCHSRMLHLSRISNKALSSGEIWNFGLMFVSAKVKFKLFSEAHQNRLCRINNSLDRFWQPFDGRDIARYAMSCRGFARYNGILWNCEHFVKSCRYGHGESVQTEMISSLVSLGLSFVSLLTIIQLPAWLSLWFCWCFIYVNYIGMCVWRSIENVAFVFMRKHDIPVSIFNIPECFPKMNYTEKYYTFCFWMFSMGLRLYIIAFLTYLWDFKLVPSFGIK